MKYTNVDLFTGWRGKQSKGCEGRCLLTMSHTKASTAKENSSLITG